MTLLAQVFPGGLTTRKANHLEKLLFRRRYRGATLPNLSRIRKDYLPRMNYPTVATICCRFLDPIQLKLPR